MADPTRFNNFLSPAAAVLADRLMNAPKRAQNPRLTTRTPLYRERIVHSSDRCSPRETAHRTIDTGTWTSNTEVSDVPHPLAPRRY